MTQRQRVLELLQKRLKRGVKCWEFTELSPKIMRYGARIWELNRMGYNIECELGWDKKRKQKTSVYKLLTNS